jgi:hypothetical protein
MESPQAATLDLGFFIQVPKFELAMTKGTGRDFDVISTRYGSSALVAPIGPWNIEAFS